jgi:hypothetical protein
LLRLPHRRPRDAQIKYPVPFDFSSSACLILGVVLIVILVQPGDRSEDNARQPTVRLPSG